MFKGKLFLVLIACAVGIAPLFSAKQAEASGSTTWADLVNEINLQLPAGTMRTQLVAAAEAIEFYEQFGTDTQLDESEDDYMELHLSFEGPGDLTQAQGDAISNVFDAALAASRLAGTSKKKWFRRCNNSFLCKKLGITCWYKTNWRGHTSCHDWP